MSKYNKVTQEVVEQLKKIVGESNVIADAEGLDRYKTDEETDPRFYSSALKAAQCPHTRQ